MKPIFTITVEKHNKKEYVIGYIKDKKAVQYQITDKKKINYLKEKTRIRLLSIIAKAPDSKQKEDNFQRAIQELGTYRKKDTIVAQLHNNTPYEMNIHYNTLLGVSNSNAAHYYNNIMNNMHINDEKLRNDIIKYRKQLLAYRTIITFDVNDKNGNLLATITLYGVLPEDTNIINWWIDQTYSSNAANGLNNEFKGEVRKIGGKDVAIKTYNYGTVHNITNMKASFA